MRNQDVSQLVEFGMSEFCRGRNLHKKIRKDSKIVIFNLLQRMFRQVKFAPRAQDPNSLADLS
jgi:hypothetical protein